MAYKIPLVLYSGQEAQIQPGDSIDPAAGGVPSGTLLPYAGVATPAGYLPCDGASYLQATYPALAAALSYTGSVGTTSGSTSLAVPGGTATIAIGTAVIGGDIPSGATVNGILDSTHVQLSAAATATHSSETATFWPWGAVDATHFSTPDLRSRTVVGSGQGNFLTNRQVGGTGGEETHVLSVAELPGHTHNTEINTAATGNLNVGASNFAVQGAPAHATSSTGGGGAHNTMPPWAGVHWVIKT